MIRKISSCKPENRACRNALAFRLFAITAALAWSFLPGPAVQAQSANPMTEQFQAATQAMKEGRLEEAAAGFAGVVKTNPAFAEAHFDLGLVRESQGRHADAIPSFQKALALKPRLHGANLFLGLAQFRLNRLAEAATAIQKETAAYSKDPAAWMWLGVVQLAGGKNEDAATSLDRAAKLDPGNTDILYHRGQAHLLVSRDSYTLMFKQDPKSWRVRQVLAQTAADAERYQEAIAEYLQAIKIAPTQPGLHEELGTQYRSIGKFDEAVAAFRRELEIDPYNVLATYKLGILAVEQNRPEEGLKLLESAVQQKPDLINADYHLGRAKMALNDDQAALEHLKRATINGNSDLETIQLAWYQLGIVYRRLKRNDEARQAMTEYQKLKDEEASGLQQRMKRYTGQQNAEGGGEPAKPVDPNP